MTPKNDVQLAFRAPQELVELATARAIENDESLSRFVRRSMRAQIRVEELVGKPVLTESLERELIPLGVLSGRRLV